jgi:hypothetical protein
MVEETLDGRGGGTSREETSRGDLDHQSKSGHGVVSSIDLSWVLPVPLVIIDKGSDIRVT